MGLSSHVLEWKTLHYKGVLFWNPYQAVTVGGSNFSFGGKRFGIIDQKPKGPLMT